MTTDALTHLATLAAFAVACIVFGFTLALIVQDAIERRQEQHTHAPEAPWPVRPPNNKHTNGVDSRS